MSSWDPVQTPGLAPAPAAAAPALRPLSIGELFDRAFSLYFRHILTFAAVLFVATIPYAIVALLQLYMQRDILSAYVNLIQGVIQHPTTPPDVSSLDAAISKESIPAMMGSYALSAISYLVALFILPLANAAVVAGVSRAYLGLPVRFRVCYQDAFRRWGYVLLLTLLWLIVAIPVIAIAMFGWIFAIIAVAALGVALRTVGIIIASIVGIALTLICIALAVMSYMAFGSSFVACVLEKADPIKSFTLGVTRVFSRDLFARSLWVATGLIFIYIGFAIVAAVIGGLSVWLTKSLFFYVATAQIINVFFIALAFVVVSLYYYDTRIRHEGFDIQVLADQLAGSGDR
ncbi:MAG TPA: hypothetical protein VFF60_09000 [Candidatus Binatus sp.]|nr:hypothetical protein [Candidatus Binatus sp.]